MLSGKQVLDDYFPEVRAWLIQIAATMDRFERSADGDANAPTAADDERLAQYQKAIELLASAGVSNRAEQVQLIFSDPVAYEQLPYERPA
jgi:hypothetical protein